MCEMLDLQAAQKVESIPPLGNTSQKRIVAMATDIEEQVVERIKKSRCFAMQHDESIDVSNHASLLCLHDAAIIA